MQCATPGCACHELKSGSPIKIPVMEVTSKWFSPKPKGCHWSLTCKAALTHRYVYATTPGEDWLYCADHAAKVQAGFGKVVIAFEPLSTSNEPEEWD